MAMSPERPNDATARTEGDEGPRPIRESALRDALRQRRRRRIDEAGLQSLVRSLATETPPGGGR